MNTENILRIIKGECTPEERKHFFQQVSDNKELAKEYARVKNKYIINTLPYTPSVETLFNPKKQKHTIINILTKIAAILFIPLLIYILYDASNKSKSNDNIYQTLAAYRTATGVRYLVNPGIKASLTLPDSTKVWLNSASSLDIPDDFDKNNRIVFLSGEGYFQVETDTLSPFLIKTPKDIIVRVTGTEFNLSCYENDNDMKLTLLKGSLELIQEKNNDIIKVKPNQQIIIDYKSEKEKLDLKPDTDYATAWKEGNLRFENTMMDEVVRKMERWYGIHISVENPEILKHTFTADFESESISQVLGLLNITTNISYEIEGNKVRLYLTSK